MKTARTVEEVRSFVAAWKREGLSVGLVPTMGYLHEGHESLITRAVRENDRAVVSIFVNPAQFAPNEDLDRYPRDLDHDLAMCGKAGADLIFYPEPETMYPPGFHTTVAVDGLTAGLCGKSRPTHFQGVCTVVCKLFNIVMPEKAYFGQKDAQQLAVISRMASDLNMLVEVVGCPIVREPDGLAKSSRNSYLTVEERKAALALSKTLRLAEEAFAAGEKNSETLLELMRDSFAAQPLARVDYIEIVDALSLAPVTAITDTTLIAVAAFFGKTRLIDNIVVRPGG